MMPPASLQMTEYLALPTFITAMLPASAVFRKVAASGPSTQTSPMWERSKRPAVARTALCSANSEPYFSGMSQPPKSVKDAPSSACWACREVFFGSLIKLPFVGLKNEWRN